MTNEKIVGFRADDEVLKDIAYLKMAFGCDTDTSVILMSLKLATELTKARVLLKDAETKQMSVLLDAISESNKQLRWLFENMELIKRVLGRSDSKSSG